MKSTLQTKLKKEQTQPVANRKVLIHSRSLLLRDLHGDKQMEVQQHEAGSLVPFSGHVHTPNFWSGAKENPG